MTEMFFNMIGFVFCAKAVSRLSKTQDNFRYQSIHCIQPSALNDDNVNVIFACIFPYLKEAVLSREAQISRKNKVLGR